MQDFLESREALIRENLRQESGGRTARKYADLMDRLVRALFIEAGFRDKVSAAQRDDLIVLALGSYGRRELCLESDVDLMVIHRSRLSPEMARIIPRVTYPLWDAKLEVGHSVLTVQECIRLALTDFRVLTSVMDARFLLGSRTFYKLFEDAFWSRIEREKGSLLKEFLTYREKRAERYDNEGYFVEPDIKEGLGGLRDLHFMAWIARLYFRCKRLSEIRRFALFSHFELEKLGHSKTFLLKVRNHLHLLAGRKEDRLLLSFQKELSRILGYQDGPHLTGPDRFMRNLYLHLNRIRYGHEEFRVKAMDILYPLPLETEQHHLPPEFKVMKGNIALREEGLSRKNPLLILKALQEANSRGLFLGSGLIWEARKKIGREGKEIVALPGARELFLDMILKPTNPKIIRLALEIGLVGLFIPEFKRIMNLAEFGFYHVETVDLHSLRTLEVINGISRGAYDGRWPLLSEVYSEIRHTDWLFLAGLLHDVGKGYRGDHSKRGAQIIPRILKRLGIHGEALDVIPFLVEQHLLLALISQRRDLSEEKTSVRVAQMIQDKEVLKMLFLLTIADSLATGPVARSDWKIMLLIELFFKVKRILERGILATPDATKKIEMQKKAALEVLAPAFPEEDIAHLMDQVSSRYFLTASLEDISRHLRLALTLGEHKFLWALKKLKDASVTRVLQCIHDRPGLFSKMVGVFTLNNIKVLSAAIFTLKNGLAFDIYEVTNPLDKYRETEHWERIRKEITLALDDELPLDGLIDEKDRTTLFSERYLQSQDRKVEVNNEVSDFFTVVEVSADERVGRLYELAKGLFSLGLDIRFARVNADDAKMTGVFYVTDSEGQKVFEREEIEKIRQEVLSVLE